MHSKWRRWNIPIFCEYLFLKITSVRNNFEEFYLHVCCFGKLRNLSEIVWKPMATTEIESVYKIWRKRYPNKLLKTADLRPSKNNWERIHGWNLNHSYFEHLSMATAPVYVKNRKSKTLQNNTTMYYKLNTINIQYVINIKQTE